MRPPCGFKSTRRQSFSARLLLADCLGRGQGVGPKMQRVSEVQFSATSTNFCTQDYSHRLALCCLGPGHGGTIQDGMRWPNSVTCRGGQVHQVDRSKANQEAERSDCRNFHLRYHNSVRHTTQHHHRQWHKLCQRSLGSFLRDTGHLTGLSVCCPPAVKRPGRASKWTHPLRHQAPTGCTTGAIGRLLAR